MVKEFIDITPHRSIMCKISQTGYSVQEAISELIDNSIDARLEKEKLTIKVTINKEHIIIEDTGKGMIASKRFYKVGLLKQKRKAWRIWFRFKNSDIFFR